ncbi:MAG TPA: alpha/beta hydrolase [Thermoleophilaceae bacterium]|nr:alpha/beta hydrolase [Thermoleophilaceae bacterium]
MSREWRSPDLGPARTLDLGGTRLRVHEVGQGPPIAFVHGVIVNANLWRKVIARLSDRFRCIALDMPFGSHVEPVPGADLSPPTVANMIADAFEQLGLEDVTLVGNDTGGAMCQLAAVNRPERLGRLVLTSCDSFERFPPPPFGFFKPLGKVTPAIPLLFAPLRVRAARRLPIAYGWVTKERIEPREAEDSYVLPLLEDARIREDLRRLIPGLDKRYTLEVAERLPSFDKPVLLAWSAEDKLFPRSDAERLAETFPNARLEWVEGARTFSAEDQPERVAELIASFVGAQEPSSISA